LKLPSRAPGRAELRIGFDEVPPSNRFIGNAATIWALSGIPVRGGAVASAQGTGGAAVGSSSKSRAASPAGDYVQSLRLADTVRELNELAQRFDNMRNELVGVNERLRGRKQGKGGR